MNTTNLCTADPKKRTGFRSLFIPLLFILPGMLAGQQSAPLIVNHADSLVVRSIAGESIRELIGNVDLRQEKVHITCDRATQNLTRNQAQLSGNVRIIQDTLNLFTDEAVYHADERRAVCERGIRLNDGKITLTASRGDYNTMSRVAQFRGDVRVRDRETTILTRSLTYERDSSKAIARGDVIILIRENNAIVHGDSVIHYHRRDLTIIPLNPRLWQIDSVVVRRDSLTGRIDSLRLDTLTVTGRWMEAHRDSTARYIVRDSVEIVRGELSARCDDALFLTRDSVAILHGHPILWYGENQVTGDSIRALLADGSLNRLEISGNAFGISTSRPDDPGLPAPAGRFDQTKGRRIIMRFRDDEVDSVIITRNAQRIYFLYDEGALNGVNVESGDIITIAFEEGKAATVRTTGGVEGIYHPEQLVTGREETFRLDGFQWREDRPVKTAYPKVTGDAGSGTGKSF